MTAPSAHLSTFVGKLAKDANRIIGESSDHLFGSNGVYVSWRGKIRSFWHRQADNRGKIEQIIKKFGLLAPCALAAVAVCKNPLLVLAGAAVAFWATRKTNMFSTLKHSVIRDSQDGFTAAALLASSRLVLKSNAFYALVGFVAGYALAHLFDDEKQSAGSHRSRQEGTSSSSSRSSGELVDREGTSPSKISALPKTESALTERQLLSADTASSASVGR